MSKKSEKFWKEYMVWVMKEKVLSKSEAKKEVQRAKNVEKNHIRNQEMFGSQYHEGYGDYDPTSESSRYGC